MTEPRSYCWIAGYTKRLETGATSAPEEDCASLEPGEWEAGQRAAEANAESALRRADIVREADAILNRGLQEAIHEALSP